MMIALINNHLPALQIILPLFGGLFAALCFGKPQISRLISVVALLSNLIISIYSFSKHQDLTYAFGNWQAPVGIEYKLDFLNKPLIIFINIVILLLILFWHKLLKINVIEYISNKRQNLFYAILLLAHTGYIGMLSTNDIFNLYVFIEISSLCAYVMIAQGNNIFATKGAFDYLMIGSIGATLILIAIGFLLSHTGTLSIIDIKYQFLSTNQYSNKVVTIASCFIIVGVMLKLAFFPLHFWIVNAYRGASNIILSYFASITTILGIYMLLKVTYFLLDYRYVQIYFNPIIKSLSLIAIIICSFVAAKERSLKNIIIYSGAANISYMILLVSLEIHSILFIVVIADCINKTSLFVIAAQEDNKKLHNNVRSIFIIITLISNAGLPISQIFAAKISILDQLVQKNLWLEFCTIISASVFSIIYNFKIGKIIYFDSGRLNLSPNCQKPCLENIGMIVMIIAQIVQVIFYNWLNTHIWQAADFTNII